MKVMLLVLTLLTVSCSHHHKESKHHHHEKVASQVDGAKYNKKCAHSVMEGDTHVEGKEEFKVAHSGHDYYFSTKEKMDAFNKDIKRNISKADEKWINNTSK